MIRTVSLQLGLALALLLLVEGAVRVTVPEITPVGTDKGLFADSVYADTPGPRPGASGLSNGARFSAMDAAGYGFWRYAGGHDPSRRSWLLLGDSVTMGIGVHPDSTFAGRLAHGLPEINVLNPSMLGYSGRDYAAIGRVLVPETGSPPFELSRVFVFWCLNDIYSSAGPLPDPDQTVRDVGGSFLSFARRHLHIYQFLKATLFDRPRRYWEYDSRLYRGELVGRAAGDLGTIAALASERRIEVTVVLLPYEYQLRQGGGDGLWGPQKRMSTRLRSIGIVPLDPSRYLLDRVDDPADLFLYGDGIHFSSRGHDLISRFLREGLSGRSAAGSPG